MAEVLRVANASGYYGDRFTALRDLLQAGGIDVLTGDYLAELTMLILAKDRAKDPAAGYARTFLRQFEDCAQLAKESGVKIVVNAGGLNPGGLADAVREVVARLGLDITVGVVEGDDLSTRGDELGFGTVLAANAYLGAWGIVECLKAGADVVITGRVTDASLALGAAAAHFGWSRTDYDVLAGAVAAGHVIECSTQATGGNFSFFTEIADLRRPGFPIAEIYPDGSSVITKQAGTGGAVTTETVTAQLLYEITGARYAGPDVTTRIDTVELSDVGPDRVRISGVRGEAPPPTLKVGLNSLGGYRNEMTFVLTGLDIDAKADLLRSQLDGFDAEWTLARTDHSDAASEEEASALLHCVVRGPDPKKVGRAFSGAAVELALASYPGFHTLSVPREAQAYGVFDAAYVEQELVSHTAVLPHGARRVVNAPEVTQPLADVPAPALPEPLDIECTRRVPLGTVVGARSGDKGGNANVGVWARNDKSWQWISHSLTVAELKKLLPEVADLPVTRHVLPNLRALNFVVEGLLGEGVAANHRFDPQAKAVGEWLRSRLVDVPEQLL